MKKFEYKTVPYRDIMTRYDNYREEINIDKLNGFGREGWELVQILDNKAIFKREIEK